MITDLPENHNGPLVPSPEAQWDVGAIEGHCRAGSKPGFLATDAFGPATRRSSGLQASLPSLLL